jgi:hypothetical protein
MIARKLLIVGTAVLLLATLGCSESGLDDGTSANVVLAVDQLQLSIVTSTYEPLQGVCVFQITESTATLSNIPKSETAITSPFNDVLITRMTISYEWDDGFPSSSYVTSPRVVIPANGSNTIQFLAADPSLFLPGAARDGHSAEVTIVFDGEVADGDKVQAVGGGALFVNSCLEGATP